MLCAAFFIFHSSFFISCSTDAYDKGEGDYSFMRADLADVHVGADKKAVSFDTDDSRHFTIENPFTTKLFTTPDSIYRLALYYKYKEVNSAAAEVVGTSQVAVLRPKVIPADEMKTDPVRFESAWLSKNRRYLNTSIYLLVGETVVEEAHHVIGAHIDTLMQNGDGTRTLHLRFYHDQGDMPEYYSQRTYMSIPLQGFDADSVSISINTYQGEIEKVYSL